MKRPVPCHPGGKVARSWVLWHASCHACAGCISTGCIQEMQNPTGRGVVCIVHRMVHQELPHITPLPSSGQRQLSGCFFFGRKVSGCSGHGAASCFEARCPKPHRHLCARQQPAHARSTAAKSINGGGGGEVNHIYLTAKKGCFYIPLLEYKDGFYNLLKGHKSSSETRKLTPI